VKQGDIVNFLEIYLLYCEVGRHIQLSRDLPVILWSGDTYSIFQDIPVILWVGRNIQLSQDLPVVLWVGKKYSTFLGSTCYIVKWGHILNFLGIYLLYCELGRHIQLSRDLLVILWSGKTYSTFSGSTCYIVGREKYSTFSGSTCYIVKWGDIFNFLRIYLLYCEVWKHIQLSRDLPVIMWSGEIYTTFSGSTCYIVNWGEIFNFLGIYLLYFGWGEIFCFLRIYLLYCEVWKHIQLYQDLPVILWGGEIYSTLSASTCYSVRRREILNFSGFTCYIVG